MSKFVSGMFDDRFGWQCSCFELLSWVCHLTKQNVAELVRVGYHVARKFCCWVNFIVLFFCTERRVPTVDFLLLSTQENQQQRENIWEKLWKQWFAFRFVLWKLSSEVDMNCHACSLFYAVKSISLQIGLMISWTRRKLIHLIYIFSYVYI